MRIIKALIIALLVALPATSFAENNLVYGLMNEMIFTMGQFVFTIIEELAQKVRPIFIIGLSIYFFLIVIQWMIKGKFEIWSFMTVIAMGIFIQTIFLDTAIFKKWVYQPIVGTTMQTANYILYVSSGKELSNTQPLLNSMAILERNFAKVGQVGVSYLQQEKKTQGGIVRNFDGYIGTVIKVGILTFLYAMLAIAYPFIYMLGLASIHILLAIAPICLMLGTIPKMRSMMMNWLREIGTFAFIPIFASIAMGLTVFILNQTTQELDALINSESADIPEGVFLKLGLVGLFSIFFHIKSTSFAARVLGGQDSNFGQAFSTASTAGMGAAKAASGKAIAASGLGAVGANASAKVATGRDSLVGTALKETASAVTGEGRNKLRGL